MHFDTLSFKTNHLEGENSNWPFDGRKGNYMDDYTPACESCGCLGNNSCGCECIDAVNSCALNGMLQCSCCALVGRRVNKQRWPENQPDTTCCQETFINQLVRGTHQ